MVLLKVAEKHVAIAGNRAVKPKNAAKIQREEQN